MEKVVSAADVKDDCGRGCWAARLRVWPRPSPSRSFARCAAPSASLTASLRHGIGRMEGQARSLPQPAPRSPLERAAEPVLVCHIRATVMGRSELTRS
jgi:hypothetical protein